MTKQTTPHTQTQQNTPPEQTDLAPGELEQESATGPDAEAYEHMEGAETGTNRTPKKFPNLTAKHHIEEPTEALEGPVTTRTPHSPQQGITSRAASEESARQEKVVKDRPDAQAGVNHSGKV